MYYIIKFKVKLIASFIRYLPKHQLETDTKHVRNVRHLHLHIVNSY